MKFETLDSVAYQCFISLGENSKAFSPFFPDQFLGLDRKFFEMDRKDQYARPGFRFFDLDFMNIYQHKKTQNTS